MMQKAVFDYLKHRFEGRWEIDRYSLSWVKQSQIGENTWERLWDTEKYSRIPDISTNGDSKHEALGEKDNDSLCEPHSLLRE